VRQARERVVLVHELRQLRRSEELLERSDHRADVDQGLRRDGLDVLGRHTLTYDALHTRETGAKLVLDQLAHGAHPAVAEVVDVVSLDDGLASRGVQLGIAIVQGDDVLDRRDDVVDRQRLLVEGLIGAELLVDLVATDLGRVVALRVEVVVVQQRLRSFTARRFARTQLAIDVEECLVLSGGVVLLQRQADRLVLAELLQDLCFSPTERLQQDGDALLALAVEADADHVTLVDLELKPRTTRRNDLGGVDVLVGRLVRRALEVDTG